jgi:hypothetical protein
MEILSLSVSFIMAVVALFHFYWAFGGTYGLMSAGPSIEGKDDFIPPKWLIFIVACLLAGLAILAHQLIWTWEPLVDYLDYLGYLVAIVFVVRAIGDFKYVGFFKKIYNSPFAHLDTRYFSPLILFLGIAYGAMSWC